MSLDLTPLSLGNSSEIATPLLQNQNATEIRIEPIVLNALVAQPRAPRQVLEKTIHQIDFREAVVEDGFPIIMLSVFEAILIIITICIAVMMPGSSALFALIPGLISGLVIVVPCITRCRHKWAKKKNAEELPSLMKPHELEVLDQGKDLRITVRFNEYSYGGSFFLTHEQLREKHKDERHAAIRTEIDNTVKELPSVLTSMVAEYAF